MKLTLLTGLLFSIASATASAADDIVTATGAGIADSSRFPSSMQAKMLSRRAAMADAQRNLLEQINGVRVTAGTTVENMMVTSDRVGTRVKGVIQGAFVMEETSVEEDGGWLTEITLGLCVTRNAPDCQEKPTLQQAITTSLAESKPAQTYRGDGAPGIDTSTGLIVDVSDVRFSPFLDVRIQTEDGEELYGPSIVRMDAGNDWLNYAANVTRAQEMTAIVGNSPLVIEAASAVDGYVVVVSNDDAARIHGSNQGSDFLTRGKVVFVMSK